MYDNFLFVYFLILVAALLWAAVRTSFGGKMSSSNYYSGLRTDGAWKVSLYLVAGVLLFVVFIAYAVILSKTERVVYGEITKAERVTYSESSRYQIWVETSAECYGPPLDKLETFKVVDSWVHGRFDTADFYGRLVVGNEYEFTVDGWRVPLLSMMQNVIEAEPCGL